VVIRVLYSADVQYSGTGDVVIRSDTGDTSLTPEDASDADGTALLGPEVDRAVFEVRITLSHVENVRGKYRLVIADGVYTDSFGKSVPGVTDGTYTFYV
jgi:hypothetical protein